MMQQLQMREWRFFYHSDRSMPGRADVFVFGSNMAGRHGVGAAQYARKFRGAEFGIFEGLTGSCYAIPTKDENLKPLPIAAIAENVAHFLDVARSMQSARFFVTRVGCGLAGFSDAQIAPLFMNAPSNCNFAYQWRTFLEGPYV